MTPTPTRPLSTVVRDLIRACVVIQVDGHGHFNPRRVALVVLPRGRLRDLEQVGLALEALGGIWSDAERAYAFDPALLARGGVVEVDEGDGVNVAALLRKVAAGADG